MTLFHTATTPPAPLPFRIRLSDGRTRTDPETFTEAEIADAGYIASPEQPAYDAATQRVVWTGAAWLVEDLPPPDPAIRAGEIKTECSARILAVGSEAAQMNIAQAGIVFLALVLEGVPRADALAAAGLQEGDLTLAQGWKAWVGAMQTECRRAIETGDDPVWPEVPEGVAGLAARF